MSGIDAILFDYLNTLLILLGVVTLTRFFIRMAR